MVASSEEPESVSSRSVSPVKRHSPALFNDVEDKTDEALSTFTQLKDCTYGNKSLGSSGQQEYMTCDCVEDWDSELQANLACSEESNCINRVTSVECVNGKCGCGNDCGNQRFQKHQYANISVFQTEKKGYGVRANENIPAQTFIYEYIGEVIDEKAFRQRMVDYDLKKFKHFYFMMLKNDSFIDATVKGSMARFCNHSCSPNVYVDKWVVGKKLRMGLFSKRSIVKGEELTFDYNVDRYGAQSQPCYCGEPNCIGFMGGKTQTDAALLLPDGIAEALGVTPKQEKQWLKENKHLRTKQQDDDSKVNEAFIKFIEVSEVNETDVSKVMGSLMKSQDINVIRRLIERIYKTNDNHINSLIIRFHGYKSLATILKNYQEDDLLIEDILTILTRWPKFTKNKISSSQIEDVIRDMNLNSENDEIKDLSANLLAEWSKLHMAYRIPKNDGQVNTNAYGRNTRSPETNANESELPKKAKLREGWEEGFDENTQKVYYFHRKKNLSSWEVPRELDSIPKGPRDFKKKEREKRENKGVSNSDIAREERRIEQERRALHENLQKKEQQLRDMIAQAQIVDKLKREEEKLELQAKHKSKSTSKSKNNGLTKPEVSLETKWTHLLAHHVPNLLKKYEKEIGRDNVKGCAKDMVLKLVAKEVKKGHDAPKELDSHRLKKIKEACTEFMDKFLVKYHEKQLKKKKQHLSSDDLKKVESEGHDSKRQKI